MVAKVSLDSQTEPTGPDGIMLSARITVLSTVYFVLPWLLGGRRALAYLKLGAYGMAEEDCNSALKLELNVKALLRRGSARMAQVSACVTRASAPTTTGPLLVEIDVHASVHK